MVHTILTSISTFTNNMYNIWAAATNHPPNLDQQLYPLTSASLLGSLTITLDNGYMTNIPQYELVSQQRGTDLQGKYSVLNESMLMTAIATTETEELIPTLGGVFLSQNYLFVDYDSNVFGLSPVNMRDDFNSIPKVMKVCTPAQMSNETTQGNVSSRQHISGGAIAGAVIGSITGLLAIVAGSGWLYRKRRPPVKEQPVLKGPYTDEVTVPRYGRESHGIEVQEHFPDTVHSPSRYEMSVEKD